MRGRGGGSKIDLLGRVSLFSACSRKELSRIASLADEWEAEPGTVIITEGQPGGEFFVIADGRATAEARGRKVATLRPGSFFGEMALLDRAPRSATITADTPMSLLVLDPRGFDSLVRDVPSVARKIMKVLAQRIRDAEDAPTYQH